LYHCLIYSIFLLTVKIGDIRCYPGALGSSDNGHRVTKFYSGRLSLPGETQMDTVVSLYEREINTACPRCISMLHVFEM
jgi:hypothetical protein